MHVVSGRLREDAFEKQIDDKTCMFAIELSEMVKDRDTGEKCYANYKAVLFVKTQAAYNFHKKALAKDSFVVISGDKLKIESNENNGKTYIKLEIQNARLDNCQYDDPQAQNGGFSQQGKSQQRQNNNQQQGFQQQQKVNPQEPNIEFDDGIPF